MDMNNLLHDVGFTGKRTGNQKCLVPKETDGVIQKDDKGKVIYEPSANGTLYPDNTREMRYEFLDRSTAEIPGSDSDGDTTVDIYATGSPNRNNSGTYDYRMGRNFFDIDRRTGEKQSVVVNAVRSGWTDGIAGWDKVVELQYNKGSVRASDDAVIYTYSRDWYALLMNARTFAKRSALDDGVEAEENILWAENSLHLKMAWLARLLQPDDRPL